MLSTLNHLIAFNGDLYWNENTVPYKKGADNKQVLFMDVEISKRTKYNEMKRCEIEKVANGKTKIKSDIVLFSFGVIMILLLVLLIQGTLFESLITFSQGQICVIIITSFVFSSFQILYTTLILYNKVYIDICRLIIANGNNNKYIKFSNKIKIYDALCPSHIHIDKKLDNNTYEFQQLKNHVTYLQGRNHDVTITNIKHLTPTIIDMILKCEIMIKFIPQNQLGNHGNLGNLDPLTRITLANFYLYQQSKNKSKISNHYKVISSENGFYIDAKELKKNTIELLLNNDYAAIHEMIVDFVNCYGELLEKRNKDVVKQQQDNLQKLVQYGLNIDNEYLFNEPIKRCKKFKVALVSK
jgi:hypothetical protein